MKKFLSLFHNSGISLFTRELMSQPRQVGAALPSSKLLARTMAAQVPVQDGLVIELGAGTGVVTEALLQRGIAPENIIVIEQSAAMVNFLRKRFPQLTIIEGDAAHLTSLLTQHKKPIIAIVSSLPLLSLPKVVVTALKDQLDQLLQPNNLVIQFTYSFRKRPSHFSDHLTKIYTKPVWFNFPPAKVEVFKRI